MDLDAIVSPIPRNTCINFNVRYQKWNAKTSARARS